MRADAPWRTLARPRAGDPRGARARLRASGTATAGIWHLALAGWLSAVGLKPDRRHLGLDRRLRALAPGAAGRRRRPRVVQPARSAGAALGRPHPQPRRDGRARACRSFPTCRPSGAGRRLDARHLARARGAEGHAARARARCSRPRSKRVVEGDEYQSAMQQRRLHARLRRSRRSSRATLARDRSAPGRAAQRARPSAGSRRTQFGPMFFPRCSCSARSPWCRGALLLTREPEAPPRPAADDVARAVPARRAGGSPRSLALDRALHRARGDAGLHRDRGRAAARLPAPARHAARGRRAAGRCCSCPPPITSSRCVLRVPLPRGLLGW